VAAYDTLVTATFRASAMENSTNPSRVRRGVEAELAARETFDAAVRSLSAPSSAKRDAVTVESDDRLIESDLRGLSATAKGITNRDPLDFYLAVDALAGELGVESTTWPPVTPAGPTAGD